ncbi:hypothetical protein AC249_AIPGENE18044 [Exaiptasia diaphana]|nr:hypothetical protein AC249_AIPGENE18044 [Exaiptasia diaphana]
MPVIVRKEENASTHALRSVISMLTSESDLYAFIVANIPTQYNGCTKAPTPKSDRAKERIRIYEGVHIDGVLMKVKMIKKFKTQATTELKVLIAIKEIAKPVSSLSKLSLLGGSVKLFITKCEDYIALELPSLHCLYSKECFLSNSKMVVQQKV